MIPNPNEVSGIAASSSSRRVYILRRLAGGLILMGIILLFFKDTTLWFDLGTIILGVILWLIAGLIEGRRRRRRAYECDDNGNAVKKVL